MITKSRFWSFYIITVAYILAIAAAILTYKFLDLEQKWLKILLADIVATIIIFAFSVGFKNSSIYDPYWSIQPIIIVIAMCLNCHYFNLSRILMVAIVCVWGLRLTANWAYTFKNLCDTQDWRYVMLKEKTRAFYPLVNFFGIHLFPTLVVYACVLPIIYVFNYSIKLNLFSIAFLGISILAVILQTVSDIQMHTFKKKDGNGFIRVGLWKYSRHPNYLGEILLWWGIALAIVVAVPARWYLAFGALINTLMFLFFSIPVADKHQARKAGFKEYKKQTRILLPIKKIK